jgi:hypothetical protein
MSNEDNKPPKRNTASQIYLSEDSEREEIRIQVVEALAVRGLNH